MSSWATRGRQQRQLDDPTADQCSHIACTVLVTTRFKQHGITVCQEHALDTWARVNEMMNQHNDITPPSLFEPHSRYGDNHVGWVYYIRIGDRVKIGHSMDIDRRLATYPPNMEFLMARRGDRALERAEHARFADYLADGREWFHASDEVLARIEDTKRLVPPEDENLIEQGDYARKTHPPASKLDKIRISKC